MVINMFQMREDIQAYHMGGMGCAMGVLGLNLARDMLVAHPGKICLFVSSEVSERKGGETLRCVGRKRMQVWQLLAAAAKDCQRFSKTALSR